MLEDKATAAARAAVEAAKAKREDEARRKARLDAGFAEASLDCQLVARGGV